MKYAPLFETVISSVAQVENKILYIDHNPIITDVEQVKEHFNQMETHLGRQKHCILGDIRRVSKTTKKARDYFNSIQAQEMTIAAALLIDSGISRIIGNMVLTFTKLPFPSKLFTNQEKALDWLRDQKRMHQTS